MVETCSVDRAGEHVPTFRIATLGCRVNTADSLAIEREMEKRGYRRAAGNEDPDMWVVNTCAVTAEGMKKSRKLVRKCARTGSPVIVTGCAVDMDPDFFGGCQGVAGAIPNGAKPDLARSIPLTGYAEEARECPVKPRVRVPLKVQDGCARFCSYCVVPFLRGHPKSVARSTVREEVRRLKDAGVGEVNICGIDLGSYTEPVTGARLEVLIRDVLSEAENMWVRLSSLEISDITDGLLDLMREEENLCSHLHIPLQSGDDQVLADMNRQYGSLDFRSRIVEIRDKVPGVGLTTDVMVGFPTETDEAHGNTLAMIGDLGFSRVHVFRYSPRSPAAAFKLGDPVPARIKAQRSVELRELAASTTRVFQERFYGRIIPVLIEEEMRSEPGLLFGRAGNYLEVIAEGSAGMIGNVVPVRVLEVREAALFGAVAGMRTN